jgi:hypothetical protein
MEVPALAIARHERHPPADDIFAIPAACGQHLLDLLTQVLDPRKRRGRRHALAGLLAGGVAVVRRDRPVGR